jgi:hypothetical protein
MQRVAKSRRRSEPDSSELVCLIRRTHNEHDARSAMSAAIRDAEVVVIGTGDSALSSRIASRLDVCGGRLVEAIGPDTRFAIRAERATADDTAAASASGVGVIDEAEFERMLEVYTAHTGGDRVRAAARRAVDANRIASSTRPAAPFTEAPRRHMVTSRQEAKRAAAVPPPKPLTEHEQELERHARNLRSLSVSAPFSRKPPERPS